MALESQAGKEAATLKDGPWTPKILAVALEVLCNVSKPLCQGRTGAAAVLKTACRT